MAIQDPRIMTLMAVAIEITLNGHYKHPAMQFVCVCVRWILFLFFPWRCVIKSSEGEISHHICFVK